jgi:hypothetical protein
MVSKPKLDIFAVLTYLDENNLGVHDALRGDPDMLKELERNISWMVPQWMSGAMKDSDHADLVESFNAICNNGWFDLYGHPELQAKLLACCGTGKKVRHKYYKPSIARTRHVMHDFLSHKYQDIRDSEVALWVRRSEKSDVRRLAESLGYQKDAIKDLNKAYDTLRKI